MKANVRVLGHAVHPILVTLPIGLGVGALAFDAVSRLHPDSAAWPKGAFVLLALTLMTGALAAITGIMDWYIVPAGTRAKRIGLYHMSANVLSLMLIAVSVAMRWGEWHAELPAQIVSTLAILNFGVGGWLGGELVERLGIGVDPGAHPNASSSMGPGEPVASLAPPDPTAHPAGVL